LLPCVSRRLIAEAAEKFKKPINITAKQKALMEAIRFIEVHEEVYKVHALQSIIGIVPCVGPETKLI
jgi:hypothetical protein